MQDGVGALGTQRFGQLATKCFVVGGIAAQLGTDHFRAVGGGNKTTQPQLAVVDDRVPAERHLATAPKRARESAFGLDAVGGLGVVERRDDGGQAEQARQ